MSGPLIFSNPFDRPTRQSPAHTPRTERPNPLSRFDSHSRKSRLLSRRHGLPEQNLCEADIWTLNHIDTGERWCSPVHFQKDGAYSQPRSRRNAMTSLTLESDEKVPVTVDFRHFPEKPTMSRRKTNVFDLIKPVDDIEGHFSPSSAKTKANHKPEELTRITVNLTPTMNLGCFEPSRCESSESVDYITSQRRPALGNIFDACPGYPQVGSPAAASGLPRTQAKAEMVEKMSNLDVAAGPRKRRELNHTVSRFTFVKVKTLFERR